MHQDARADVCLCRISEVGKIHKARSKRLLDVRGRVANTFWLEAGLFHKFYIAFLLIYDTKYLVITIGIV